jgi:hypothetical protein
MPEQMPESGGAGGETITSPLIGSGGREEDADREQSAEYVSAGRVIESGTRQKTSRGIGRAIGDRAVCTGDLSPAITRSMFSVTIADRTASLAAKAPSSVHRALCFAFCDCARRSGQRKFWTSFSSLRTDSY